MIYRQATEQDFFQLVKLRWDFKMEDGEVSSMPKPQFYQSLLHQLKINLERGNWTYWIAEENGIIVSQIFLYEVESIPRPARFDERFGYVTNVYTKPEYRGQGIGAKLMQRVIEYAKQRDLELLLVWPSETSTNFYQRAGFQLADDVMKFQLRDY